MAKTSDLTWARITEGIGDWEHNLNLYLELQKMPQDIFMGESNNKKIINKESKFIRFNSK